MGPYALPLDNVSVVELAQGVAGPFCCMQLGLLGACVVKIEPPEGDWMRQYRPRRGSKVSIFSALNRNKRGIRLDLRRKDTRSRVRDMVATADVVCIDRATSRRWHDLSYRRSVDRNPGLIWAELSPFGATGPLAAQPATEFTVQMMAGVHLHLGGDGTVIRPGFDIASMSTAVIAFNGILAALLERQQSGLGQEVDVSLLSSIVSVLQWNLVSESKPDEWVGTQLAAYSMSPNYGFPVSDGAVYIDFRGGLRGWRPFLLAIGRHDLAADTRFDSDEKLIASMDIFRALLRPTMSSMSSADASRIVRQLGGTAVSMLGPLESVQMASRVGLYASPRGDLIDKTVTPWYSATLNLPAGRPYRKVSSRSPARKSLTSLPTGNRAESR